MARTSTGKRSSKGAFNFGVTINPSPAELAKRFGIATKRFSDYRPAFRLIVPHLATGIGQNIKTRGASIGETWPSQGASWHLAYLRRKQRGGYGVADLILTRRVYNQVTSPTEGLLSMGRMSVRFGSDLPYARAVNFGMAAKGARRRMFMGWSAQMKADTEEILDEYTRLLLEELADEVNRAGGGNG